MKAQIVIGANYGDEGKGLVSGCLAREAYKQNQKTLTVFYNGTMQRAHTFEGEVHRAMAAGTKYGSDTFYHKQFVIDPISLFLLQAKPIIDGRCRIILPCDVVLNREKETLRGKKRHGSCGFGLYECVYRSLNPRYRVQASELLDAYSLYNKLKTIRKEYPIHEDDLYNTHNFMLAVNYIVKHCRIDAFEDIVGNYDTVIFEGGQGLMLDQNNNDCFPYLTPSSTGCRNIVRDIQNMGICPELYYVSRSYLTRHGAGENININIVDSTNISNEWQGDLRFGRIDMNNLDQKIRSDSSNFVFKEVNIVFTQLNYTNNKLETVDGRKDIEFPYADNIYVSDQKDYMTKM